MEERAGGVLPSKPAERDWPRMDPPNVLWFAGAYALAAGSYVLLGALPESHSSVWIFVAGLAFLLVYSAASHGLLGQRMVGSRRPRCSAGGRDGSRGRHRLPAADRRLVERPACLPLQRLRSRSRDCHGSGRPDRLLAHAFHVPLLHSGHGNSDGLPVPRGRRRLSDRRRPRHRGPRHRWPDAGRRCLPGRFRAST